MPKLDERLNPDYQHDPYSNPEARELIRQEKETGQDAGINAGIDQAQAYANDPKNSTSSAELLNGKEKTNNEFNYPGETDKRDSGRSNWKGKLKKFGPGGGIAGILIAGMLGLGALNPFGLLLVGIKEVVSNYGGASSRAASPRFSESLYYRLSGGRALEQACRNPASIKCKRGTMKDKNVTKLKEAGFKVETKKVGITGRHIVNKISFEGIDITDKKSAKIALNNPRVASAMDKAINPKSLVFLGDRFQAKVLAKFGLNKGKVSLKGSTPEERKASINQLTGGDEDKASRESKVKIDIEDRLKNGGAKVSGSKITSAAAGSAGIACLGYNVSRTTIAAVKAQNILRYTAFAMLFLKAADQIKANGDIDPETVAVLGTVLTNVKTSGPQKGLSATDSQGYKVAAYGGETGLQDWTKNYVLGGNKGLQKVEGTIDWVNDKSGGKRNVKAVCKGATNPFAGAAVSGALCAAAGGGSAGTLATTIFPGVGTAVGFVIGTVGCTVGSVIVGLGIGWAIGKIIEHVLPGVVESLAEGDIDVTKIGAVDAGNALALGAGLIMQQTSLSRGMQPGTKDGVMNFLSQTNESAQRDEAVARYDARDEPFNIYDQYSFLGSFLRSSGLINVLSSSSATGTMSFITGSLNRSVSSITSTASASATMPVNITQEDLSHCPDISLTDVGVDCDVVGGVQYVMNTKIPVEDNLDFMERGGYIDEEGNAKSGDYEDWVKNCTDERTDPIGVSSVGIEDEDGWSTGEACVHGSTSEISQSTRDQFSTFYYDQAMNEDEDSDEQDSHVSDGAGGDFTIASFNILHIGKDPHERIWRERLPHSINTLKENGVQVAGLQEVKGGQNALLQNNAVNPTYDIWPKDTNGGEGFSPNPVIWDRAKFTMVKGSGELRNIHYDGTLRKHLVIVKLKDNETDQMIYVVSTHDPRNGGGRGGSPTVRRQNAEIYKDVYAEKASEGVPIFLVGDFNSNNDGYCVLTGSDSDIINAYDAEENHRLNGKCPSKDKVGIDHIYLTKDDSITVKQNSYKRIQREYENNGNDAGGNNGSDHDTIIASISIAGSDSGGAGGGVDGDDYAEECGKYLSSGDCTGECVGFVKFRLVKHGVIRPQPLGSGGDVTTTLEGLGFKVDTTPAVHSVMSLRHNSVGHTAMVSKVNADGSIVVEEYNWPGGHIYGKRTISIETLNSYRLQGIIEFAHTETKYR